MGHVGFFLADGRLGHDRVAQQFVTVRHIHLGRGIGFRVALHHGNAQQGYAGTAGFRLKDRGVHRFHIDDAPGKGIVASRYGNGRGALVIDLGGVHYHRHAAYADADGLGRYPAAAFRLQADIAPCFPLGGRQGAAVLYIHEVVGNIGIMGHADRHRNSGGRYTHHVRLAPGLVTGFHGQVAIGGSQGSFVDGDTGIALGGKARITHAYAQKPQACLHRLQVDGFIIVGRHVALAGRQGHTGAFYGRILDRDVIQLVQVVNHIRHVHRRKPGRTAAAVQARVVQFGIGYRQGATGCFQRGAVPHIGMYARALQIVAGLSVGLNFFLHLLLLGVGHAVEVVGVILVIVVVYAL